MTRSLSLLLAASSLLAACGSAASSGAPDASTTVADGAPANVPDATPEGPSVDEVFAAFDTIETVAGTGLIEDKGVNGWQPGFEGGAAIEAELSRPHIALGDGEGGILIADKDAHAIRRVDSKGQIHTVAGTSVAGDDGDAPADATSLRLNAPNGLWVVSPSRFYVLDLGNDKVRKVDGGQMSTLFRIGGTSTGRGLWVSDDEELAYVSAGGVLKRWTPEGGVEILASGFVSLGNLAVEASGSILVTDRGGHRVYRVSPEGDKRVVAGDGTSAGGSSGSRATAVGLNEVRGVWPYPEGGFFVATHKGGQIWYVDVVGDIHLMVNGDADDSHSGDGKHFADSTVLLSEPRAVTMDTAGNLLITEHDGGYVRRVRAAK